MTVLYEKRGRRYVPVSDYELYGRDLMRLGQFRLTYCYSDGGRRYSYGVTPATASFVAAAEVAAEAMERAIINAVQPSHSARIPLKPAEIALIAEFRKRAAELNFMWPDWWQHSSARDIAAAGIKAVQEYAP